MSFFLHPLKNCSFNENASSNIVLLVSVHDQFIISRPYSLPWDCAHLENGPISPLIIQKVCNVLNLLTMSNTPHSSRWITKTVEFQINYHVFPQKRNTTIYLSSKNPCKIANDGKERKFDWCIDIVEREAMRSLIIAVYHRSSYKTIVGISFRSGLLMYNASTLQATIPCGLVENEGWLPVCQFEPPPFGSNRTTDGLHGTDFLRNLSIEYNVKEENPLETDDQFVPISSSDLLSFNLVELLNSGEDADVTFIVGTEKIPAHRIILKVHSFVRSFIRSFVHSFVHSFSRLTFSTSIKCWYQKCICVHLFIHSFID